MQLHAYLSFNGNCREAMQFYQGCLGGELSFQTIGESPLSESMPKKMRDCILHATLSNDALLLMASDMLGSAGLIKGNTVSLSLNCNSEEELNNCYIHLSAGGSITHSLELTNWGARFGNLTDQFGIHWLLQFHKINNTR